MNILLTGAEGFVGRHFIKALNTNTNIITCIDIKSGDDCRDFFRKDKGGWEYDLVIHLAAIVGGRELIESDPLAIATDLEIDSAMFNWAVRTKPGKVIYFSSSAAYPAKLQEKPHYLKESDLDVTSDVIGRPDFTYGWTKLTGELLAEYAVRQYGLDVLVVRPFSGYGEDQDLTYPFPSFIKRVKEKQDPFDIWGDGKQVRDWIHIDDIVEATMTAVKENVKGTVNLGNARPISFTNLAELMFKEAKWHPARINYMTDKPSGVFYRCSDNTKMLEFYKPRITIEEGIRRALST